MGSGGILTSDHVNYMVYRYLQEAGFMHTAFTFLHEGGVTKGVMDPNNVAPGTLVALIQKGMQYLELEANLDAGVDPDIDGELKLLTPEELMTHDVDTLRELIRDRREEKAGRGAAAKRTKGRDKEQKGHDKVKADRQVGAVAMDEDVSASQLELPASAVATLQGHQGPVYTCAWSPADQLLASSGSDGTARLWSIGAVSGGSTPFGSQKSVVLAHDIRNDGSRDISALDWASDGGMVATADVDGSVRLWSKEGSLRKTLRQHDSAVFAVRFNKKADVLLSAGADKTVVAWDVKTGESKQVFQAAEGSETILDIDWRNNNMFAACCRERRIHVFKLGSSSPVKTFNGHTEEVNSIRWDSDGSLLASSSEDATAKVWSIKSDECLHDLVGHERDVYALAWGTSPSGATHLATASLDHTARLWEMEHGKCTSVLKGHSDSVTAVSFSPSGRLLATGAADQCVHVWSSADGSLVRTYRGNGQVFAVSWSSTGDKLAASFESGLLSVLDIRA